MNKNNIKNVNTLYDLGYSSGIISLNDICNNIFVSKSTGTVDYRGLIKMVIDGGYDFSLDKFYKLDEKRRDITKIKLLFKALARNEGKMVSNAFIKRYIKNNYNVDIDIDTVSSYISILSDLSITNNTRPFLSNIGYNVKVMQKEKRHFIDPCIVCSILDLGVEDLVKDIFFFMTLFEALVERDIKIYVSTFGGKVYHYYNYKNRKIDIVIELADGEWCAFEVKLGTYAIEEASKNLLKISNSIKESGGRPPKVLCVICGMSKYAYMRPDGVYVVPITALKN